jgi:hypothetical protein
MSDQKLIEGRARVAEIDPAIEGLQKRRKRLTDFLGKFAQAKLPAITDPAMTKEEYSDDFEKIWKYYKEKTGREVEKKKAFAAYKKISRAELPALFRAISNYGSSREVKEGYSKHFHRFLREDFWPAWSNKIPTPEDKKTERIDAKEIVKGVFRK